MGWLGKIFLTAFLFWTPDLFPHFRVKTAICFLQASANQIVDFGEKGKSAENGEDGIKGKNSEALTIFADGSPLNLNLSGQDGTDGTNGEIGDSALCENQPANVSYNLVGANGGDGGNGGNGGDGGDGGSLTVYASNKDYLKQITVQAGGGKGGEAGDGGNGGNSCQCPQPYWVVESCTGSPGSPNYSCGTKEYRCLNGEKGKNGRAGRDGREGKLGTLTLINSNTPLPPDRITASVSMGELKSRGFSLSKNIWEARTGATELFAPGSIINDQYLELVERIENAVVLVWNAPQPFALYSDRNLTLSLQDDQSIQITVPNDLWFQADQIQKNKVTELFIFNVIQASDATKLVSNGLSGFGENLQLELIDKAEQSDLIETSFTIKYSVSNSSDNRFRQANDYTLRYQGQIPPNLIRYSNNRFMLDLGKLPIEPRYLELDRSVQVEIEITRSFGKNSAVQTIVARDILGPFN
jgi:hypothetical protein